MTTPTTPLSHQMSREKIREALEDIDCIARDFDSYDYGLPMIDNSATERMVDVIQKLFIGFAPVAPAKTVSLERIMEVVDEWLWFAVFGNESEFPKGANRGPKMDDLRSRLSAQKGAG